MTDRVHRELTGDDIARIADTYHAWRSDPIENQKSKIKNYADIPGCSRSAPLSDVPRQCPRC